MAKGQKEPSARKPGRPKVDSEQLTPRLWREELNHLDKCIARYAKGGKPLSRHEAIRRLVQTATPKALNGAPL